MDQPSVGGKTGLALDRPGLSEADGAKSVSRRLFPNTFCRRRTLAWLGAQTCKNRVCADLTDLDGARPEDMFVVSAVFFFSFPENGAFLQLSSSFFTGQNGG